MKLLWMGCVVAVLGTVTMAARQPAGRTPVGPVADGWVVDLPNITGNVKFERFLGRDAMWLKSNTHVVKSGLEFGDGTIEFDLAAMDLGDFAAITFRRASFTDHENVYLRLRRSGDFMAMQYAPRVKGSSTWQLYREFAVETQWPRNQWIHVRAEVVGSRLDVFVGDDKTPALSVPRLRNGTTGGEVGFWARVNDRPDAWAAALSNIRIRPAAARVPLAAAPASPVEYIGDWQVSAPAAAPAAINMLPATLPALAPASAEESGLVNVNRIHPVQKQRSVVFARQTIRSDAARRVPAGIGYSDDVTVFVNGEPIYSGRNGWDSRTPQLNSFVDARWEEAFLPLRAGDNELVLAVADDQRFGWGFAVRIEDRTGLQFGK
jgi:hypothetical protein